MKRVCICWIKTGGFPHKGLGQLSPHPQVESTCRTQARLSCLQYLKRPEKFITVHFFHHKCVRLRLVGCRRWLDSITPHWKVRSCLAGALMPLRAHNCCNPPAFIIWNDQVRREGVKPRLSLKVLSWQVRCSRAEEANTVTASLESPWRFSSA